MPTWLTLFFFLMFLVVWVLTYANYTNLLAEVKKMERDLDVSRQENRSLLDDVRRLESMESIRRVMEEDEEK